MIVKCRGGSLSEIHSKLLKNKNSFILNILIKNIKSLVMNLLSFDPTQSFSLQIVFPLHRLNNNRQALLYTRHQCDILIGPDYAKINKDCICGAFVVYIYQTRLRRCQHEYSKKML